MIQLKEQKKKIKRKKKKKMKTRPKIHILKITDAACRLLYCPLIECRVDRSHVGQPGAKRNFKYVKHRLQYVNLNVHERRRFNTINV